MRFGNFAIALMTKAWPSAWNEGTDAHKQRFINWNLQSFAQHIVRFGRDIEKRAVNAGTMDRILVASTPSATISFLIASETASNPVDFRAASTICSRHPATVVQ